MSIETRRVGAGSVAHIAQDPGDGRWFWSVVWIGTPDTWDGATLVPGTPRRVRQGKADTRDQAIDAQALAVMQGRPDA
jgi:hypothetical protein